MKNKTNVDPYQVVNDISGTKKLLEDSNMTFAVLY